MMKGDIIVVRSATVESYFIRRSKRRPTLTTVNTRITFDFTNFTIDLLTYNSSVYSKNDEFMYPTAKRLLTQRFERLFDKWRTISKVVNTFDREKQSYAIPFDLSESDALNKFADWHRSVWFAPSNLSKSQNLKVKKTYMPFWCFESEVKISFTATMLPGQSSVEMNKPKTEKGTFPVEHFLFDKPEMQIYASFKHRRDFADAAKPKFLPKTCFPLTDSSTTQGISLDTPNVRQGMAWELALRNIRKRKNLELIQRLKYINEGADIQNVHIDIKVKLLLYFWI